MKKIKDEIILIGGGGHCASVIDVIEEQDIFKIAGIVDTKEKFGEKILGYKILACDVDMPFLIKQYRHFFLTIGQIKTAQRRIEIFNQLLSLNISIPVIKSPRAFVSKHSYIGKGTVIMHMAQVNANATIGNNCIINSKALIEHDARISDHCHISTGAIVNGGTEIGEASFIGSGVVCREYVQIPSNSFIKANSLVK